MTNEEKIKAKSDEQLASWLCGVELFAHATGQTWSIEQWLEWLRQEIET
ncbi:MAG: hypothetical protein II008_19130 [Oscillospiraceae bacterium]|nr:hypothetical protein [Oscillospiraceae bacterium]